MQVAADWRRGLRPKPLKFPDVDVASVAECNKSDRGMQQIGEWTQQIGRHLQRKSCFSECPCDIGWFPAGTRHFSTRHAQDGDSVSVSGSSAGVF